MGKVLVACEESQEVCKAFRALGHEAYSCDLEYCSGGHPEWHIKGDALKPLHTCMFITCDGVLHEVEKWDLVIAHPPCTRMTNAGVKHLTSRLPREGYIYDYEIGINVRADPKIWAELEAGIGLFKAVTKYAIANPNCRVAIENPIPHKYARDGFTKPYFCQNDIFGGIEQVEGIGDYTQVIQPYHFGHKEQKATCLWLYNLPELTDTNNVKAETKELPYKDRAKVHYASPGKDRAKIRSKTYPGIAAAFASQWGALLPK